VRGYYELTELGRARRLRVAVEAAVAEHGFEVARLRLITNETNGVFRADTTDGRRLVVRVGLGGDIGHPPEQVAAETSFLDHLARTSEVSVPSVVSASDGRRFVTVEVPGVPEPRNVVVFGWLAGTLLGERETIEGVRAMGGMSAQLHAAGRTFVPEDPTVLPRYDRVYPFHEPVVIFEDPLVDQEARAVLSESHGVIERAIGRLSSEVLQVVHGDLHPWNVMSNRGALAAFDFEDLMLAYPVQDVATSLYYFHGKAGWEANRDAFLRGYASIDRVPDLELIDVFLMGRALVLANDVLITPEWRPEAPRYLRRFVARTRALLDGRPFLIEE
jgi:Ser/Thr protein kinase RdoA (MazF antagonist)